MSTLTSSYLDSSKARATYGFLINLGLSYALGKYSALIVPSLFPAAPGEAMFSFPVTLSLQQGHKLPLTFSGNSYACFDFLS